MIDDDDVILFVRCWTVFFSTDGWSSFMSAILYDMIPVREASEAFGECE